MNAKSKLYKWSKAILGIKFQVGEKFKPSDLLTKKCRVLVKHQPDENNPEIIWERVTEVLSRDE